MPDQKTIIVTGAGGGLGSRTVEALAARGANVLAVDIDAAAAERAAESGRALGADVVSHQADAANADGVRGFVSKAIERWGALSGIFNNAATLGAFGPILDYPDDEFERVLQTNVRSVWLGMKHALPHLLDNGGGAIVNTSSIAGTVGWPNLSAYVASKHAVIGLTRSVALEYAGRGIRVNALCPGTMDTTMLWEGADNLAPGNREESRRLVEAAIPVGRMAQPAEVATFPVWLLLDAPQYLTGAVLPIDGGQTAS